MSSAELIIVDCGERRIALPAEAVVNVRYVRPEDSELAFDLDALLGFATTSGPAHRAIEVRVQGGELVAMSRGSLELARASDSDCYGVPSILRAAGAPTWLRGFVADREAGVVLPWIDVARLLVNEYTRRMFFAPSEEE